MTPIFTRQPQTPNYFDPATNICWHIGSGFDHRCRTKSPDENTHTPSGAGGEVHSIAPSKGVKWI
jgi:hypothetical protein